MKISKIVDPQESRAPQFNRGFQRVIMYDNPVEKRIVDTYVLNNGKKLISTQGYKRGNLSYKLQYLKDSMGNWIRSKLRYYKGRQVVKEINSYNDEKKRNYTISYI